MEDTDDIARMAIPDSKSIPVFFDPSLNEAQVKVRLETLKALGHIIKIKFPTPPTDLQLDEATDKILRVGNRLEDWVWGEDWAWGEDRPQQRDEDVVAEVWDGPPKGETLVAEGDAEFIKQWIAGFANHAPEVRYKLREVLP